MHTNSDLEQQLNSCIEKRKYTADELQNEVSQILASALLWIRLAKIDHQLSSDSSIKNAEDNLNVAIEKVRALHYSLTQDEAA